MMVKRGAIEIIFKSHEPFQSYLLSGQANSANFWQLAGNIERACFKTGVNISAEFLSYSLAPETYSVVN